MRLGQIQEFVVSGLRRRNRDEFVAAGFRRTTTRSVGHVNAHKNGEIISPK
jgi:hypothetical protein